MQYLGTKFSVTLGAWRVRFAFAVEDAPEPVRGSTRARETRLDDMPLYR